MPKVQARFPDIRIDLTDGDQRGDPPHELSDIAIRVGPLADSALVLVPLGSVRRIIAASHSCLARHGTPKPRDLLVQWPMFENEKRILLPVQAGKAHHVSGR